MCMYACVRVYVCVCVMRICVSVTVKSRQTGEPDLLVVVGLWKEKKVMSVRQLAG
jgi:hypothetical protein